MKFSKWPRRRARADYQRALKDFVRRSRQEAGIRAVYMAGNVSQPGISDLDVLVALDDRLPAPLKIDLAIPRTTKTLIGHGTILKVPERLMPSVQVIDDFPLRHIWGDAYHFDDFNTPPYELCRVLDWLPERIARLIRIQSLTVLDVTWALQFLKSLTVSLEKLSALTGANRHKEFTKDVIALRKNWWKDSQRHHHLLVALRAAEPVGLQALRDCDEYLIANNFLQPVRRPPPAHFAIKGGPRFAFSSSVAVVRHTLVLSPSYFTFYAAQAKLARGWLKRKLRASFSIKIPNTSPQLSPTLRQAVIQRMGFIEDCGAFLQRAGIKRGLLKYGWFLT